MRFSGKVVIVTGAGSGVGRAAALLYGKEGARILAADIDVGSVGETAAEIRSAGGEAEPFHVDLSSRAQAHAMVDAAVDTFARLDVLANVAGIYPRAPVEEVTEEHWDRVLAVDLKGPFFACQAAVRVMKAQSSGVIVNVASGAAFYGLPEHAAYSAAKGGLVSVGRVVAVEAAQHGIRLNTLVPGRTDTPGVRAGGGSIPETGDALPANERWMRPEEIAEVIVWCSSDDAGMVNGALLRVDGGWQML